ncbi:hypothetical protein PMIN03_010313 [Paraphaeosphaeria minitans]
MFLGGNQHSRPGAIIIGDYLYTGYASHCIKYNYTGAIIGFNKNTGMIIEAFATEGGPEPSSVKGGGIWMTGGSLSYDGRGGIYFATGNGYASQLKATGNVVPGRSPPSSLEEAAVNAKINDDRTLTIVDFFMPYEKVALDGADRDPRNNSSCLVTFDYFQLSKSPSHWRLYQNENSVYAGAGMIPLGGGYVYVPVTQFKTHVFKFSCDALGNATFSHVADTPDPNAYILGTGAATVTTMNAQDGTGLLWISDVQGYGLRIYDPIPPSNGGPLTSLRSFAIPGVTKFSHPVFGNGRVYISTNHGYLYGSGSPPVTIKCTALNQTAVQSISLPDATDFQISNVPALPFSVSIGQSFFFNGTFSPSNVGSLSRDVSMALQNPVSGYSSNSLVTLRATGRSAAHLLAISASSITFNVIANQIPSQQPALLWNLGDSSLTFTNFRFSLVSPTGPWIQPNTTSSGQMQVGDNFQQATSHHDACFFKRRASQFHHLSFTGTQPKAIVEFQTLDGSAWTKNLLFRLTNGGVPFAVPLSVAVSKPPYGIPGIIGKTNNIDLAEGSIVSAGNSQTVQMFCAVPKSQVNIPSYNGSTVWTLNTNDPDQGKLFVQLSCQAATEQIRPLLPNGTAQYGHTGYFMEGNPGRQLAVQSLHRRFQ